MVRPYESGQGIESVRPAADLTGFEDSNSSANVGIDSKAAGQGMSLSNIGDTVALLNNGNNGDSVPATVPGSELVRLTRQRLKLGPHPQQIRRSPQCNQRFAGRSRPSGGVAV
jgi:hypothetical protein